MTIPPPPVPGPSAVPPVPPPPAATAEPPVAPLVVPGSAVPPAAAAPGAAPVAPLFLSDAEREVLAIVVHDLRTPLTSIVGFSEILVGRRQEMDQAMQHEALAAIRRAAAQAVALLDGLAEMIRAGGDP